MGWWVSVPRFGVSWFFRLHVEASAHGSSGPPVLPVGSLVLWSSWLIGCGHRIIRSIAAKKKGEKRVKKVKKDERGKKKEKKKKYEK